MLETRAISGRINNFSRETTSKDEHSNFYFSTSTLNDLDERIYSKLSVETLKNDSKQCLELESSLIPSYQKLFDLTNKKVIEITIDEAKNFQKTCRYFNLWELQQFVHLCFMIG